MALSIYPSLFSITHTFRVDKLKDLSGVGQFRLHQSNPRIFGGEIHNEKALRYVKLYDLKAFCLELYIARN